MEKFKSSRPGQDLTNDAEKAGTRRHQLHTDIYNNIIRTSITPPLRKTGRIIPLLKTGKPSDEGKSYRLVSLLSPLAKILEALFQPTILQSVDLSSHQHGFRKGQSTVTALQEITTHLKSGLNQNKPVDRTFLWQWICRVHLIQ